MGSFNQAVQGDRKIKELNDALEEETKSFRKSETVKAFYKKKNSLEERINSRKKQVAVEFGLAVEQVEDMKSDYEGEMGSGGEIKSDFVKEGDNPEVYRNQSAVFEKYTHCGACDLYIKGDLPGKSYDDIGPLCGAAGTKYYCPICETMIKNEVSKMS